MHTSSNGGQGGFTLIEAVIALGIVALVVTSYLGIRTSALADGIEARNWRLAREIAEAQLSEVVAGAHETPPQSGVSVDLQEYPGFSYQVVIGESAIGEMEASVSSAAAEGQADTDSRDRQEWQRNRDLLRKAEARGISALDYENEIAAEEYQRRVESKAPSESEFEEIAVVVFFPKLDASYDGQKESFIIKTKVSTLALSGLTPEQAQQIAESQGQGGDADAGGSGAAANPFGGGK